MNELTYDQRVAILNALGYETTDESYFKGGQKIFRFKLSRNRVTVGYHGSEQAAYESVSCDMNFCFAEIIPTAQEMDYTFQIDNAGFDGEEYRAHFSNFETDDNVHFISEHSDPATAICLAFYQCIQSEKGKV